MLSAFDVVPFLLSLTAITASGWSALACLPRASAAVRHRLAVATLAAALMLPVALRLPTVPLSVLPAPRATQVPLAETRSNDRDARLRSSERPGGRAPGAAMSLVTPPEIGPPVEGATVPVTVPVDATTVLVLAWLSVTLVLAARVLAAVAAAGQLVARAQPVVDERILGELGHASERLGIRRTVALRCSPRLAVPVVFGWARPTLLLPHSASTWSTERLRSVLTHELAHVTRHDALALALTHVTTALFWFHPLVWALARKARLACEQACDDWVLACGARASHYAKDLIAITQDADRGTWLADVAPAFTRRSALGVRLVAILDPDASRGPVSRRTTAGIVAAAALLVVTFGSLRVVAAPAETDRAPGAVRSEPIAADAEAAAGAVPAVPAIEPLAAGPSIELAQSRRDQRSGEEWYDRAQDRYNSERYADAGEAYLRAAESRYRTETAYYNAACSFALAGRTREALGALEKALDTGFDEPDLISSDDDLNSLRSLPEFRRLMSRAMNTDRAQAEKRSALSEYEWLRTQRSRNEDEWSGIGVDLMRAGEYQRALEAFETEYAIDSSATSLYNQACALALAGRRPAACDRLERSIVSGYGSPEHITQDDDLRALRGQPRFAKLLVLAADLELDIDDDLFGRRLRHGSLARYERVVRERPEVGRAWFNLGYATLVSGQHARSADAFRWALALGYRRATTMYNLGCVYAQLHQPDEALRWLESAEAAGMDVRGRAEFDNDLDPLRSDPRFKRMRERWHESYSTRKATGRHDKRNKD